VADILVDKHRGRSLLDIGWLVMDLPDLLGCRGDAAIVCILGGEFELRKQREITFLHRAVEDCGLSSDCMGHNIMLSVLTRGTSSINATTTAAGKSSQLHQGWVGRLFNAILTSALAMRGLD
jgi:hypothetical protein